MGNYSMGLEEFLSVSHPTLELKRVRTLLLLVFSSSLKQRGAGPGSQSAMWLLGPCSPCSCALELLCLVLASVQLGMCLVAAK